MLRWSLRLVLAGLLTLGTAGAPQAQDAVRVASKIDTEGALLGQIVLQLLQANGIRTVDRLQLGPTPIVRRALLAVRSRG